jgi:hypothetical protein
MADGHKDYAGTPLWKKLGIAAGSRVLVVSPSEDFDDALAAIAPLPDGVAFLTRPGRDLDVVVLFVTRAADLARRFPPLVKTIAPAGRLWVAWPKKAAKTTTDVTFNLVQGTGLGAGLVDNKTAAITPVFQGLQFVIRRADRPGAR